jgi:murein DD-endopeptidase MepM/ murein hydrolase activator NlpD
VRRRTSRPHELKQTGTSADGYGEGTRGAAPTLLFVSPRAYSCAPLFKNLERSLSSTARHLVAVPALIVAGLLVLPLTAWAQSSDEVERDLGNARERTSQLSEELEGVRGEVTDAERELAEIGARLADAEGRLRQAEGQVALAEEALVEARELWEAAVADHEEAEERLERAAARLVAEEDVLIQQVVEGFKYGTVGATRGAMVLEVLRRVDDPNGFSVGMKQLRTVVDEQDATVQRVFELRGEREERAAEAADARGRAGDAAAEAADTLQLVEDLKKQAETLAAEVEKEEQAQKEAVAALREDEQDTARTLERAAAHQAELETLLQERRAAEAAEEQARLERERQQQQQRSPQPSSGAGGGPSVSGGYCPVQGARTGRDFSNDWGYPRSGGRTHQGNDVFANRGTPVIAIQDGRVVRMNTQDQGLGGLTVTYRSSDGSEWYNAHLHTIASGLTVGSSVSAGDTIGTVGNTGNARTTPPHLHLGRRVNGGWVNPYPTISELCR